MRVVSLTCSNTEIVCALGCANLLVGVDTDSDFPPAVVQALPRVGRDLDVDVHKVATLKPDLVLASMTVPGHEKVIARLEAAGLNYIAPEPLFLEDVYRDIEQIAGLLEVLPRGRAVVAAMRGRIGPPSLEVPGPRPSILVEWWPKPVIAPGRQSWVTDMIELAGGTNPLSDRDVKSMPMEDQEVRHLDPDAFVIAWCGVRTEKYRPQVLYRNPAWRELAALKNRRVYCVPEAYLGRPSPRLVEGFEALREILAELGAR